MIYRAAHFFILGLAFFLIACHETDNTFPEIITISPVNSNKIKASDILSLNGFTKLQNAGNQPLRSISKILFSGNSIVILDAETDFEDIYIYDTAGTFINKIGRQSEQEGGYNELCDIDLNAEKNRIIGLSTGNTSLMEYDFQGNLVRQLRHGSLGESFAVLQDEGYVIYNELTATKMSEYNFLIFYDKQGNVLKRAMPYPDSMDNYGYGFTGYLGKNGKDIVFSPPFCDTIFAIRNQKIIPLYVLDFQEKTMPVSRRFKIMDTKEIDVNVSYLNEGIVKSKSLLLFHFMDKYRPTLGIYDENKKVFWDALGFRRKDFLYALIQQGKLFHKSNNQFALVLEPKIIKNMIHNDMIDLSELAKDHSDLAKALIENEAHPAYLLLYLESR